MGASINEVTILGEEVKDYCDDGRRGAGGSKNVQISATLFMDDPFVKIEIQLILKMFEKLGLSSRRTSLNLVCVKNIFVIPDQLLRHEDLATQRATERVLANQRRLPVENLFIFVEFVVRFESRRRRCFEVKRSNVRR